MKRSPLKRKTPLRSSSSLAPGKPLERRTPLRTSLGLRQSGELKRVRLRVRPRAPMSEGERKAAEAWHRFVTRTGRCVVCDLIEPAPTARRGKIEGHHVIEQQVLRRLARDDRELLARLRWDVRNGLPVCQYHHARHTQAVERIPRFCVPEPAMQFARELGLERLVLDRYP